MYKKGKIYHIEQLHLYGHFALDAPQNPAEMRCYIA